MQKRLLSLFACTLILSLAVAPNLTIPVSGQGRSGEKVPDRYIVVLKDDTSDARGVANDIAQRHRIAVEHVYEHALKGFSAIIPAAKLDKVKADSRVRFVEQDMTVEAFQSSQVIPTGINRIDADLSTTAKIDGNDERVGVDIAIIDTGIDLKHPDLNVNTALQKTCVPGTKNANDDNGHGTHVAGIAAAIDNGRGVVGVAPGASLVPVKVLARNGSGLISWVICGVDHVTRHANTIEVANMSLGCACHSNALHLAVKRSVEAGVTYVVAAGNSASDVSNFDPASYPEVITVSAIVDTDGKCGGQGPSTNYGDDDTFATFSNFGAGVDLAAPGVDILSTYKGQSYAIMSGTSMASPHVAGAAALYKANNPSSTPDQVRNTLVTSGIPQTQGCVSDGNGGFTGDPDTYNEPLVYARTL